jgi:endonuclease/exonuclease/phosphatase family metal-dependent hydrolase
MVILLIFLFFLFVFAVLFLYFSFTEYRPLKVEDARVFRRTRSQETKTSYSIVTWNIGHLMMDKKRLQDTKTLKQTKDISREHTFDTLLGITTELQALDSDFCLLQEVDHDSARSDYVDQIEHFISTFHTYNASFAYNFKSKYVPFPITSPVGATNSGLLTLSKDTLLDSKRYQLDGQESYPKSIFFLKRCMLINRYKIGKKDLYIINVHLSSYDKDGQFRSRQFKDMMDFISALYDDKKNAIIVGGDFNYSLDSSMEDLPTWLSLIPLDSDSFKAPVLKGKTTMKDESQEEYMVDGFLCSSNIKISKRQFIDLGYEYSNHNPVKLTFKL